MAAVSVKRCINTQSRESINTAWDYSDTLLLIMILNATELSLRLLRGKWVLIANKSCNYFLWHRNILTALSSLDYHLHSHASRSPQSLHGSKYYFISQITRQFWIQWIWKFTLTAQIRRCNLGFITNSGNPAKRWTKIIVKPGNWLE